MRRAREVVGPEVMAKAPGWHDAAKAMNARYEAPTEADAVWADAIAFGSPTRFGGIAAELKSYIDSLGALWYEGKLVGKAGTASTSTATLHGGNETSILSFYPPMAHLGMIIVPLGYTDPVVFRAGTPYGASSVSGQNNVPPTTDDLAAARVQGRRLCEVARALTHKHH